METSDIEHAWKKLTLTHNILYQQHVRQSQAPLARQMEAILRYIKLSVKQKSSQKKVQWAQSELSKLPGMAQFLTDGMRAQLDEIANIQLNKSGKKIGNLLWTAHSQGKNLIDGFDDIAEEGISAIFSTIFDNSSSKSNIGKYARGQQSTNVDLSAWTEEEITNIKNLFANKVAEKAHWTYVDNLMQINVGSRSGKVDVSTSEVQVTASIENNPILHNLQTLFAGHTFTIKNYLALKWIGEDAYLREKGIHLGETNLFKSIYGPLTSLYSTQLAKKIFYSAINAINDENAEDIAAHFYHLRFIYELTGLGLRAMDGTLLPLTQAEFLIVNNPDTPDIYVRSTAAIIETIMSSRNVQTSETITLVRSLDGLIPTINIYKPKNKN